MPPQSPKPAVGNEDHAQRASEKATADLADAGKWLEDTKGVHHDAAMALARSRLEKQRAMEAQAATAVRGPTTSQTTVWAAIARPAAVEESRKKRKTGDQTRPEAVPPQEPAPKPAAYTPAPAPDPTEQPGNDNVDVDLTDDDGDDVEQLSRWRPQNAWREVGAASCSGAAAAAVAGTPGPSR
eukprot:1898635-Pyramimonas_sp.AAC.3